MIAVIEMIFGSRVLGVETSQPFRRGKKPTGLVHRDWDTAGQTELQSITAGTVNRDH